MSKFFVFGFACFPLFANPQNPLVVGGAAAFSESSHELQITTTGRTIINWENFSIGADETTRFIQDAPVLNRVVGFDQSVLLGRLLANGEIYLINPQGILVGKEALIQTAGFIASTLNVDNAAFLAGAKLDFFGDSIASVIFEGAGKVVEEGGRFFLVSNDLTELSGSIEASQVRVLGDKVHLTETARIDAPGGEVLVGGDYKGQNPEVKNAQFTQVEKGALINVDGKNGGDGGKAIFWADNHTVFLGNVSCKGFNGGFIEVSGKQNLFYDGSVDLTPSGGKCGTLLLDPKNILVRTAGGVPVMVGVNTDFSNMPAASVTLTPASVTGVLATGALVLQANTDIYVAGSITSAGFPLTLQAGRSVSIGYWNGASWELPTITMNGGAFSATVNDNGAVTDRDMGAAAFLLRSDGSGSIPGSTIFTDGGNVTINHGSLGGLDVGAVLLELGTTINAGTGRIDITGVGDIGTPPADPPPFLQYQLQIGVQMHGVLETTAGSTGMTITGTGAATPPLSSLPCDGVRMQKPLPGSSLEEVRAATGLIEIIGTGGGNGTTVDNRGIFFDLAGIGALPTTVFQSTGMGANAAEYRFTGIGGNGTNGNIGIYVRGTDPFSFGVTYTLTTIDGDIFFNGTGGGTGNFNDGIWLERVGLGITYMVSTGDGNFSLTGFGSTTGGSDNAGIRHDPDTAFGNPDYPYGIRCDGTGSITLNGTGGGSGDRNYGVSPGMLVSNSALVTAGTISITGQGSTTGTSNNHGVFCAFPNPPNDNQIITTTGDVTIIGTGGGTGAGTLNHGVTFVGNSTITTLTAGADAANIFATGNGGIGDGSIGINNFRAATRDGDVTLIGTGGTMGINCHGIVTGICSSIGDGQFTATGIAGAGAGSEGVIVAANLSYVDGSIDIIGTGSAAGDPGIEVFAGATVLTTGAGVIGMRSLLNSIEISGDLTTSTGTMRLLADNNAADITWFMGSSLSCGGGFIAVANNDITIQAGVAHMFTTITADAVYVVDEQDPTGVGPGRFDNFGSITTMSNNLAIYAASGPFFPVGVIPGPIQFISVTPATAVIGMWDSPAPAGANPPIPLNAKYSTFYQTGGPYHGPGFGAVYAPGQGVFGSEVVWYKYLGLIVPGTNPVVIIPLFDLDLIGINTIVDCWQHYLFTPYLPCPIFPCLEIADGLEEIPTPPCHTLDEVTE